MAELAAIASIIGVSDFMLRGIKSAYDVVEGLQQAPDQVKRIATELKGLQNILRSIDTEGEAGPIVKKINEEMKLATMLENCANVCRDLETKLEKWMPNPDEPSLLNRARIQAHRGAIREWRNVIRDTKDSWTLAEVIPTRRLHVLSLRLQNRLTDEHAEDLHQEVTSEVRTVIQEAERSARLDQRNDEQDPEEERALTKDSRPEQDDEAEGPENASGDQPGAIYTSAFQDMVREATRKAVRLSKSVVKQNFGDLEMEDNNGYDQGLAGEVEGDVIQTFNKTKIGSGNKVRQGIYKP